MKNRVQSLTLPFFPYKKICEVPLHQIQQQVIHIFKNWGMPQWIKVDNGRPFGDPKRETIPPLSLWLIALGIQVIWNTPRQPKENAKVERAQGTLGKWTEYKKCFDGYELQLKLWRESEFYNHHFPIRRLKGKKRIEVFPKLRNTNRPWNPKDFDIQRVLNFLSHGCWERQVSVVGQTNLYGNVLPIGMALKNQSVSIRICPKLNHWKIYDTKSNLIKTIPTTISEKSLWHLDL